MKYLYPAIQPGMMVYADNHIFVRMYRQADSTFKVDYTTAGDVAVHTNIFRTYLAAKRHAEHVVKALLRQQRDPLKELT